MEKEMNDNDVMLSESITRCQCGNARKAGLAVKFVRPTTQPARTTVESQIFIHNDTNGPRRSLEHSKAQNTLGGCHSWCYQCQNVFSWQFQKQKLQDFVIIEFIQAMEATARFRSLRTKGNKGKQGCPFVL